MAGIQITNYGYDLVAQDLNRLKRIKSLKNDLEIYFNQHINTLKEFGKLSCEIAANEHYSINKERIATRNPRLSPSEGCRLWFAITKSGFYIPCLLYSAKEEKDYPKSTCFKVVHGNLQAILNES